jgi:hypothetical protein
MAGWNDPSMRQLFQPCATTDQSLPAAGRRAGSSFCILPSLSRRHSHPCPEPVREPNRCNLEPLKLATPKTTLYLVLAQGRLTLQVACLGLAHFRLPLRPPESPSGRHARTPAGPAEAVWSVDRARRPGGVGLSPLPAGRQRGRPRASVRAKGGGPARPRARPVESCCGRREGHAGRGDLPHQRILHSSFFLLPFLGGAGVSAAERVQADGGLVSIVRQLLAPRRSGYPRAACSGP